MVLRYLIRKEFLQIKRNSFLPKLILVFPVVIMCVMPWVMNMEVKHIVVDVVDHDRSTVSQRLIQRIEASGYFIFNGWKSSYDEALKDIEKSEADIVLVISPDYERRLVDAEMPEILIVANSVNSTKGVMGTSYLTRIVSADLSADWSASTSKLSVLYLHNRGLNYKLFMIPALMGLLVMLLCGSLPALNIVGEKEAGTIEQINVTPVSKWVFILAKIIPYWIIAVVVMSVCFIVARALYGVTCQGNLIGVVLVTLIMALFFSSFGLIISNYSDTMQQAMFVIWFFVVCLMLLSGLFTPVRSMPRWAQRIDMVNPMLYYVDALRTVFIRGGGFASIAKEVGVLSCFAVGAAYWAIRSYKKNR